MKRLFMAMLVLCGAVMLTGCGDGVDENKTPAQIKSEAANMSVADLESMIAKYAKAVEKKAAELKAETAKLADIPLTEQLGDEAKKLRGNVAELTKSLDKLKANLEAYADSLKAKK